MNVLIPPGSIVDGWAFVSSNGRLGDIKRTGPVSGIEWGISKYGTWIYEEDAYEFFELTERVRCTRRNGDIEIHPVLPANPGQDHYRNKPSLRKEI